MRRRSPRSAERAMRRTSTFVTWLRAGRPVALTADTGDANVHRTQRRAWLSLLLVAGLLLPLVPRAHALLVQATTTCDVVCENAKPGTPQSQWDVSGAGDPSI